MKETIVHSPKSMDLFNILPERVISTLFTQIYGCVEQQALGETFVSPFEVLPNENANAVQPDIFVVSSNRLNRVDDAGGVHGVPDLVIDVLTFGDSKQERVKKNIYQNFRVKEYWLIDPTTRKAKGYELVRDHYQMLPESIGKITSPLLGSTFRY